MGSGITLTLIFNYSTILPKRGHESTIAIDERLLRSTNSNCHWETRAAVDYSVPKSRMGRDTLWHVELIHDMIDLLSADELVKSLWMSWFSVWIPKQQKNNNKYRNAHPKTTTLVHELWWCLTIHSLSLCLTICIHQCNVAYKSHGMASDLRNRIFMAEFCGFQSTLRFQLKPQKSDDLFIAFSYATVRLLGIQFDMGKGANKQRRCFDTQWPV